MGRHLIDMVGRIVGKLTVIRLSHVDNVSFWECRCECGKTIVTERASLTRKEPRTIRSCGCLTREKLSISFRGNKKRRLSPGESGFNILFSGYKNSSKVRGIEFDLSKEFKLEFKRLTKLNCHYCGIEPLHITKVQVKFHPTEESVKNSEYTYNGIDRFDNDKGYVLGNIVPCCQHCNLAKSDYTAEEFMEWIAQIVKHHEGAK